MVSRDRRRGGSVPTQVTPQFLADGGVWGEIRRIGAARRSGATMIATAYVGPHGLDVLQLGRGDAVHCALSLRNARAGVVCPATLRALRERGVRLYADESLHAKIYLFPGAAIVGSANASRRSAHLDEAALVTHDPAALAAIRAWFERRQDAEVSDAVLAQCERAYRPPRWAPFADDAVDAVSRGARAGRRPSAPGARQRQSAERWWLLWNVADDGEYTAEEDAKSAEAEAEAKQRVARSRWRALEPILWTGDNAVSRDMRVGDKVVCAVPAGRGQAVTPWGTCLGLRRWRTTRGVLRLTMSVEFPQSDARVGYQEFARRARSAGLPLSTRGRSVALTRPEHIRALRALTSPNALRK